MYASSSSHKSIVGVTIRSTTVRITTTCLLLLFLANAFSGCPGRQGNSPQSNSTTMLQEKRVQPGASQSVTIYYEQKAWKSYIPQIEYALNRSVDKAGQLVKVRPGLSIDVVLIHRDTFFQTITEAPWVTAAYHRGKIFIPIDPRRPSDLRRLTFTVAHEYTHAVIDDLTHGNAPAWLDEGIALVVEGTEQLSATALFFDWLQSRSPIPLSQLTEGFTTLQKEDARHAYIQSRETVEYLLANFGSEKLNQLLYSLADGKDFSIGFQNTYHLSMEVFESNVQKVLKLRSKQYARRLG